MNRLRKQQEETDKMTRIAIVEKDRCKPKNCGLACKKSCPVVRMGIFFTYKENWNKKVQSL